MDFKAQNVTALTIEPAVTKLSRNPQLRESGQAEKEARWVGLRSQLPPRSTSTSYCVCTCFIYSILCNRICNIAFIKEL